MVRFPSFYFLVIGFLTLGCTAEEQLRKYAISNLYALNTLFFKRTRFSSLRKCLPRTFNFSFRPQFSRVVVFVHIFMVRFY